MKRTKSPFSSYLGRLPSHFIHISPLPSDTGCKQYESQEACVLLSSFMPSVITKTTYPAQSALWIVAPQYSLAQLYKFFTVTGTHKKTVQLLVVSLRVSSNSLLLKLQPLNTWMDSFVPSERDSL